MKRTFIALLLCFFSTVAVAGSATLSWTNATQNEDSSDIPATGPGSLDKTTLNYGICEAGDVMPPVLAGTVEVTPDIESYVVEQLASGRWCFVAYHTNVEGTISQDSNVAAKDVLNTPNAPGMLTVADVVVFTMSKIDNAMRAFAIGTVPPGTSCDPSQSVNGKHAVPVSEVVWDVPGSRDIVVYADCS